MLNGKKGFGYCQKCGKQFVIIGTGHPYHIDNIGALDYDLDEDHIPIILKS